jgi:hypothetical protein
MANAIGALRASQDADGRLEVFYIGTDNVLYHTWQIVPDGGWSGEYALGASVWTPSALGVALRGWYRADDIGRISADRVTL